MLLWVILTCLAASVQGFGLAGAYERMFYYYAYLLDHSLPNPKLANGCPNGCSFDEFIKYIGQLKELPQITNEKYPDIHQTAKRMYDMHQSTPNSVLLGNYQSQRVAESAGNVANLISEVAAILEPKLQNLPDAAKTKALQPARDALKNVGTIRKANMADDFKQELIKAYPDIQIIERDLPEVRASTQTLKSLDLASTAKANPDFDVRGAYNEYTGATRPVDLNHYKNLRSCVQAMEYIGCS